MSNNTLSTVINGIVTTDSASAENGSNSSPSISFINGSTSGLFWDAVNGIGLSVEGDKTTNISSTFITSSVPINMQDVSAPSLPAVATEGYIYKKPLMMSYIGRRKEQVKFKLAWQVVLRNLPTTHF